MLERESNKVPAHTPGVHTLGVKVFRLRVEKLRD